MCSSRIHAGSWFRTGELIGEIRVPARCFIFVGGRRSSRYSSVHKRTDWIFVVLDTRYSCCCCVPHSPYGGRWPTFSTPGQATGRPPNRIELNQNRTKEKKKKERKKKRREGRRNERRGRDVGETGKREVKEEKRRWAASRKWKSVNGASPRH